MVVEAKFTNLFFKPRKVYMFGKGTLILRLSAVGLLTLSLGGCEIFHDWGRPGSYTANAECSGNAFLERYNCSIERIQQSAENGNPDAQYALGYMYFYGINTVRDVQTAQLWIRRAAAQNQPLARRALEALSQGSGGLGHIQGPGYNGMPGASGPSLNQPQEDVRLLNTKSASQPLSSVLPIYGKHQQKQNAVIPSLPPSTGSSAPPGSTPPASESNSTSPLPDSSSNPSHLSANGVSATNKNLAKNDASPTASQPASLAQDLTAKTEMSANDKNLLLVKPEHYTLQIMSGQELSALQEFIDDHHLQGKVQYYSVMLKGEPWYMLIYGNYNTEDQAKHAEKHLATLLGHAPWIKPYSIVHEEILTKKIQT